MASELLLTFTPVQKQNINVNQWTSQLVVFEFTELSLVASS